MNATADDVELGWYHIDEVWQLYVDEYDEALGETKRVLRPVRVDFICVDETPDDYEGEGDYHVDHYDTSGDLITSLRLTADDVRDQTSDREPTDRPWHI